MPDRDTVMRMISKSLLIKELLNRNIGILQGALLLEYFQQCQHVFICISRETICCNKFFHGSILARVSKMEVSQLYHHLVKLNEKSASKTCEYAHLWNLLVKNGKAQA